MKLIDSTNPVSEGRMHTLISEGSSNRELSLATRLNFHVIGLYEGQYGPEWSSHGKQECDFLHHIDIVIAGRRQVVHKGKSMPLEPGKAYFLPGNTPVERRCNDHGKVMCLKFRCEWLPGVDPLFDWTDRRPALIGPCNPATLLRTWVDRTGRTSPNRILNLRAQLETWMAIVLPDLDSLITRHLESYSPFVSVFNHIEEQLSANLRVDALARVHGTSINTFSRVFQQGTGLSPKDYLKRRLNQAAIQYVINTDMKMKEIADKLQFNDEFYFSRFFSKMNNKSPAAYRRVYRVSGAKSSNCRTGA